jgi:hypothetical protein
MTTLMTAVVELRPDAEKFRKETARAVEKAAKDSGDKLEKSLGNSGEQAGKRIGSEVEKGVKAGADKAASHTEKAMKKAASESGKAWDKVNSIGNKMTVGVTMPVVAGMGMAIKSASNLGETVSATGVIFGTQGDAMQQWGDNALKTMGLAKNTALSAANAFGGMFSGMGMSSDQAAKMAQQLVERGRDIKSMYNAGSTEEVLQGLRSAMAGETEPLRRFGVSITQAKIEAEALSAGLVKAEVDTTKLGSAQARVRETSEKSAKALKEHGQTSLEYQKASADAAAADKALESVLNGKVGALNDQQKAQAILNIIMRESAITQGDYQRTQDSTANSMERTKEQAQQVAAQFGQKLLPVVGKVLTAVSGLLDRFNKLSPTMQNAVLIIAGIVAAAGPIMRLAGAVRGVATAWTAVRTAAIGAAAAQEAASAAGGGGGGFLRGGVGRSVKGLAVGAGALGVGLSAYNQYQSKDKGFSWGAMLGGAASGALAGSAFGPWGILGGALIGGALSSAPAMMAEGGTVAQPGLSWIGERGPELLSLPRGAQVTPLEKLDQGMTVNNYVTVQGATMSADQLASALDRLSRDAAARSIRSRRL